MQNTLRKILTFKKVRVSPRLSKILVPFWLSQKMGSSTIRAAVWQIRTDSLLLAAQITWAWSAPDTGDAGDASGELSQPRSDHPRGSTCSEGIGSHGHSASRHIQASAPKKWWVTGCFCGEGIPDAVVIERYNPK